MRYIQQVIIGSRHLDKNPASRSQQATQGSNQQTFACHRMHFRSVSKDQCFTPPCYGLAKLPPSNYTTRRRKRGIEYKSTNPISFVIVVERQHSLAWEDGNSCSQTSNINTKAHKRCRPAHIGQKDDNPDTCTFAKLRLSLNRIYRPFKIGRYTYRRCQSYRSDNVVKDIESGIDSQKTLPLSRCQWAQAGLFRKAKPSENEARENSETSCCW